MDCCGLTKRWSLYVASTATPGSRLDLPAGRTQSLLTDSMRAVASDAVLSSSASQAPLRATCSKSQPPHLVFEYIYYRLQNLSSDHLLSGVKADYRKPDASSIRAFRSTEGDNIPARNRGSPKKSGLGKNQGVAFIAAVAGTEIRTSSGVLQLAFPSVSCKRFMVTFSD